MGVARGATLELHGQNKLSWAKLTSTVNKADYESGVLYRSSVRVGVGWGGGV